MPRLASILLATTLLALASSPVHAQDPLSDPRLAQEALQSNPEMQRRLAEAIANSGLSQEQLRSRLRAAGYDESLLDSYMAMPGQAQRGGLGLPGLRGEIDAVRELGLVAETEADSLLALIDSVQLQQPVAALDSSQFMIDSLVIFGMDVFAARSTRFMPDRASPVPDTYRLGPGDRLALILAGDVEEAHSLDVSRDGFIVVPSVGTVHVAGLNLTEVRELLFQRLSRVYSGIQRSGGSTRFDVSVSRQRSVQIYVAGEARRPGAYVLSASSTPLMALYAAGGPTRNGSLRRLEVRRNGALVDSVDVYGYLLRGIDHSDLTLQSGDVIFIPVQQGRVEVTGEVVRPAVFEVQEGETLRDVIGFAGGFDADALRRRVQVHRILPAMPGDSSYGRGRVVVDVGPEQLAQAVPSLVMLPGDSVTVFPVAARLRGFVTVEGNVWLPGQVGFTPGMQLSQALNLAGGPKPDVYLGQVLVSRLRSDSTRAQLRTSFADTTGRLSNDLVLQEDDVVRVFSRTTFRPERYVVITGAVRQPGRIEFREGMTVRDAILLADGLAPDAYLVEAEIARVPDTRSQGQVATTIRVPLDSTYLFARGAPGEYQGPPGPAAPRSGSPEVVLQPYDNLLILRQPEWELVRTVTITGQVKYPGPYALRTKTERLLDVIQRAGGLTSAAYADGIEFYRRQDSAGRVGIDLKAVLRDGDHRDNLILAAGDSMHIPEFDPIVMVRGAVNSPGAVAFEPGRDLDFYVRAAGGYSKEGDKRRAFVTQPNGDKQSVERRFLLPDSRPAPRPGAEVMVPVRDPAERGPGIASVLGVAAQLLASVVTVIVVARN
ncbi:MAG TPA: SLBB domain-containing protein [Gemmatimonadales bacterium]|nr:SLBB domain-containing protein [Gemmatimonadales bacterium]